MKTPLRDKMEDFKRRVKEKALSLGAAAVGIANADLYEEAPEGHRPEDLLKGATCAVSMVFLQPRNVIERSLPTQYTRNMFTVGLFADNASNSLALWLEHEGYEAMPVAARGMCMDALAGEFRGDLSHKHTAVLAGLGSIGINTLFITPEFGNRVLLSSVVTNALLIPDSPFSESLCLGDSCLKCVEACPVRAIRASGTVEKAKCARHYRAHYDIYKETCGLHVCWECRRVCPVGKKDPNPTG